MFFGSLRLLNDRIHYSGHFFGEKFFCTHLTFDLENLTLKVKNRVGHRMILRPHGMVLHLNPLAKNQQAMPSVLFSRVLAG